MNAVSTMMAGVSAGPRDDRDYDAFRARVQARFLATLMAGGNTLFTTSAEGLFGAYLDALPAEDRQHHTCHACRRFFENYAGLVTIDAEGRTTPAVWSADAASDYYRPSIAVVERAVRRARVTGVFRSNLPVWGQPVTGEWTHYAVTPPDSRLIRSSPLLTAGQTMAEKLEDYRTVQRALAEFDGHMLDTVVWLLESEALYRAEAVIGPAWWLRDLSKSRDAAPNDLRDNIVWRAVATAPSGFCHPRASMIGTLLEDVAAGMLYEEVSRRFAAKMRPLQYQRPQVAPAAGNIAQAEKIFETLGLAAALRRRFARLEDVTDALWRPAPPTSAYKPTGGVFGHLTPKGETPVAEMALPTQTMTWTKFRRTVLPTAAAIEFHVPRDRMGYGALTTAVDPAAPPILQWDHPDRRNPVAWYTYPVGTEAEQWGLKPGTRCKVVAIVAGPSEWHGGVLTHFGERFMLLLDGAAETRRTGLALFPESLRSELRQVRATIEAHSRTGALEGSGQPMAAGPIFRKGDDSEDCMITVTVTADGHKRTYKIDRWD